MNTTICAEENTKLYAFQGHNTSRGRIQGLYYNEAADCTCTVPEGAGFCVYGRDTCLELKDGTPIELLSDTVIIRTKK